MKKIKINKIRVVAAAAAIEIGINAALPFVKKQVKKMVTKK